MSPTDQDLVRLGQLQAILEAAKDALDQASRRPRLRAGAEHQLENYRKLGHWQLQFAIAERDYHAAAAALNAAVAAALAA